MTYRSFSYKNKPLIWPLPNECRWMEGCFDAAHGICIVYEKKFETETKLLVAGLNDIGIMALTDKGDSQLKIEECSDDSLGSEGYTLHVSPQEIVIRGKTNKGVFYGIQSLIQLIENSRDGIIPAVHIVDVPFKPLRGVHFYVPSRRNIPWFKKLLDFLAKYKYNTIYMEIGAAMEFDSHPEINEAWEGFCMEMLTYPGGPDGNRWGDDGMQMLVGHIKNSVHIENGGGSFLKKEELADLIQYANKRHLEIIPEVQGLSHAYWMLLPHHECAERDDDPYPDTWCPSNPRSYDIYFDCLQEVVDLFGPQTVHIGHDEVHTLGMCKACSGKTGHDLFAGDVLKIHDWLKERGIRTTLWNDKFLQYVKKDAVEIGMACGGSEYLQSNERQRKNELVPAAFRAIDMLPSDIVIMDWQYSLDILTQELYYTRGMDVVFGNFNHAIFVDMEARLRRPNVLGAVCSLWHETSELGMAMTDGLVRYLDMINILWHRGCSPQMHCEFNDIIAQLYPLERDRMNGAEHYTAGSCDYRIINISSHYNGLLNWPIDYSPIIASDKVLNTIPFSVCNGINDFTAEAAYIRAGHGMDETIGGIQAGGKFKAIAFLHAYTKDLGGPPMHACSYVGPKEDIVGCYSVEYADGTMARIPVEYSRTIIGIGREFGAHCADPIYQTRQLKEVLEANGTTKESKVHEMNFVIYAYIWRNPAPGKEIRSIGIEHTKEKDGGIAVFAITGIV